MKKRRFRNKGKKRQFGGANYPDEKPAPQGQNKPNGGGNHSAESDLFWTGKTASGVFGEPTSGGRKASRSRKQRGGSGGSRSLDSAALGSSSDVIPNVDPTNFPPLPPLEFPEDPPFKSASAPPAKRDDVMPHRWHPDKGFQALTRSDFPEWHVEAKEIARKWPTARKALYKSRYDDFGWKKPHKTQALKSIANEKELGKKMIEVAPAKKARTYKLAPPAWSGDEPASPKQPVGQMGGRKSRTRRRKKSFRRRRKRRKRRKSRRRGRKKNGGRKTKKR